MRPALHRLSIAAIAAISAGAPQRSSATAAPGHVATGFVEAGAGRAAVSGSLGGWDDQYVRASGQITAADRIAAEVSRQRHFRERGTFLGVGYTRALGAAWYGFVGAGTSDAGFFLPRLRVDGSVHRKWLARKQLVTSAGFGYVRSRGIYSDRALLVGVAYYLQLPVVLEVGARVNESNPGAVRSARGAAALTWGRAQQRYLAVRYEMGNEAYQLASADRALVDFFSREISVVWRQWIAGGFGVNVRGAAYRSSYRRSGVEVGVFRDF